MIIQSSWELKSIKQLPTLSKDALHIWRTRISKNIKNIDYNWSLLTQNEQIHSKKFSFIKEQNRYIITRAILREIISGYIDTAPQNIFFKYTEYGKPYLANNHEQKLKFNLAHSGDCIVFIFSKYIDIGIDIEFINKELTIKDTIKYCCSEKEQHTLYVLPDYQKFHYFYKLWVIKEALVKAIGLGLSCDLRKININLNNKSHYPMNIKHNNIDYTINTFRAYNEYYSAFAVNKPIHKISFLTYEIYP